MNQVLYRLARMLFLVSIAMTLAEANSLGSIALNLTEAYIDQRSTNGPFDISLLGNRGDNGAPFVITFSASSFVNHPFGYWGLGETISPTFNASGLDLSTNTTGSIEITGPGLTVPDSIVPELTISGPVTFELYLPFYSGGSPDIWWGEPEELLMATGTGVVDIRLIAHLDWGPPFYEISDVSYSLARSANVEEEETGVIPEPSTLFVWTLLGMSIAGLTYQRRRRLQIRADLQL